MPDGRRVFNRFESAGSPLPQRIHDPGCLAFSIAV